MTKLLIEDALIRAGAAYEIIAQDKPILTASDVAGYYPLEKAAPTFVLQADGCLIGCIASYERGRLDFDSLKAKFGYAKLRMADKRKIRAVTGFDVGSVPLAGLGLPCLFDRKLLDHDYIYGGTGNEMYTLKISPAELLKAVEVIGMFE